MAAIRILQVFAIMNRGGAESMIMNYYRNIDRTKIQFDFLVHRKEKAAFDDEIERMRGKIFKFDPINPLFPNAYYKKLRTFFKINPQYTIIHAHMNTFSYFPLKIACEFGIPCRIAHSHNALVKLGISDFIKGEESLTQIIKNKIKFKLQKRSNQYVTHRFSCGDKAGKWLFGKNADFTIINNAVDAASFAYNPQVRDVYKSKFGFEENLVLGHVGGFSKQKNHEYLLRIFQNVLKSLPETKLVLIGDGPLRKKIEMLAKEMSIENSISFLGVRSDIAQLVQMLDIFVFPSFFEGLPVTLIEAQSAGLKIIASDKITKEVNLTGDIDFLSIDDDPCVWTEKISHFTHYDRQDNFKCIQQKKYDITENAKVLQNFYLKES